MASTSTYVPAPQHTDDDPRVLQTLRAGKLIEAIRLHREITGVGLTDAKRDVEALASTLSCADTASGKALLVAHATGTVADAPAWSDGVARRCGIIPECEIAIYQPPMPGDAARPASRSPGSLRNVSRW